MKGIVSFLLILPCVFITRSGASSCLTVSDNKCVCTTSNFTLDISFAFPDGYVNKSDHGNTGSSVVISPCKDYDCGGTLSRGCQWDATGNKFVILGKATDVVWDVTSKTDFTVTFGDGNKTYNDRVRQAQIKSLVTPTKDTVNVTYDGESGGNAPDPLVYMFTVSAKSFISTGGGGEAPVGIAGLVIMILLLVGVITYFIVGGIIMYTLKGARGAEVVPNHSFWKDLPFLIKDGFLFTFGPCCNAIRNKGTYSAL